jgi:hypothetical protein
VPERVLIVGGVAAVRCALELRTEGYGGRIAMVSGVFGEARPAVDAGALVVCGEARPQTELVAPLRVRGIEPLLVGDALRPRRAHDAVADGARVGRDAPTLSSAVRMAG